MSYDDQYDAPMSGPERVRVTALQLVADRGLEPEAWAEAARPLERYIIGPRAVEVQQAIEAAYALADDLLPRSFTVPLGDDTDVSVNLGRLRELVRMLSGLSDGPPF